MRLSPLLLALVLAAPPAAPALAAAATVAAKGAKGEKKRKTKRPRRGAKPKGKAADDADKLPPPEALGLDEPGDKPDGAAIGGAAAADDGAAVGLTSAARCEPVVDAKIKTLVMELEADKKDKELARSLGQVVAEETAKAPGLAVMSQAEIKSALNQAADRAAFGCEDTGCLAEIADALDAAFLVSGRFSTDAAGAPLISLSLLNTKAVVTVSRVNLVWTGDEAQLPEVARAATQLLVLEKSQRKPGGLLFDGLPDGASISLDGEDVTDSLNDGKLAGLEVGPHEVTVAADGYLPAVAPVLVQSGKDVTVELTLEEESIWGKWWLWTAAGTLVAATVTGTLLVAAALQPSTVVVSETPALPVLGAEHAPEVTP